MRRCPGGYPDLLAPDETEQITHAYGPNTDGLLTAKRRYAPDGVFHAIPLPTRAAIPPAGVTRV